MNNSMNNTSNNPHYTFSKKFKGFILSILGIALIIAIHELGHFSVAQLFNIPVNTFSIGFGPTIFKTKLKESEFRLALFPIGGYVQLAGGENGFSSYALNNPKLFRNRPYYQQLLVMLGGIIFNIIFGIIGFAVVVFFYKYSKKDQEDNSLEQTSQVSGFRDMLKQMQQVAIKKNNKQSIQGPIGIISLMSQASQHSLLFFIFFLSFLSFNLALFNILPFPPLDGGQIMLLTIEALLGHPLAPQIIGTINLISITLFILFFIYVTTQDIRGLLKR